MLLRSTSLGRAFFFGKMTTREMIEKVAKSGARRIRGSWGPIHDYSAERTEPVLIPQPCNSSRTSSPAVHFADRVNQNFITRMSGLEPVASIAGVAAAAIKVSVSMNDLTEEKEKEKAEKPWRATTLGRAYHDRTVPRTRSYRPTPPYVLHSAPSVS
jgi:hypothetical protein